MTHQLISVPLARCELHPGNRKRLGDMKELTADIAQNGVEVPLIGRYLDSKQTAELYPDRKGTQVFQVLAGARRLTALRALAAKSDTAGDGFTSGTVEVVDREYDDTEAFRFLMRENLHREDVHPLDDADYFRQLIEEGASVEMIAAELGKSDSFVHKRLQLNQLTPAARKVYEAGKVGAGVAMELARLPKMAQDDLMKRITEQLKWEGTEIGPKQVRKWALKFHVLKLAHAAFSSKDPELWKSAGSCTDCPKRSGNTPSLFGDLTTEDVCTERRCYEEKAQRHMAAQIIKLNAEGVKWRPVSSHYSTNSDKQVDGKPIVQSHFWRECRQKDEHSWRALIVASDIIGDVGRTLWALNPRDQFKPAPPSPQEKAARAREKRQQQIKGFHRHLMFLAVAETKRDAKPPSTDELKRVALAFFKRLWDASQQDVCKILGWDPIKQRSYNGWDYETTAKKRLEVMKGRAEVMGFLDLLTVAHDVKRSEWDHSDRKDELTARAKELGVDVAKLKRQAEAKYPTVKATKKTTKKKKATT